MGRALAGLALAILAPTVMPAAVQGQSSLERGLATAETPLLTTHPVVEASLKRIAEGSALWRQAVHALRKTGRRALIVTPEQVVAFDPSVLAEVAPVPRDDSRISVVLVVVNLSLLEQVHTSKGSLPGELAADLDSILVHEIYGHALPYLIAGDLSGRCADPRPDQRPSDACSIRRENAVRAELGLSRRTDYGVEGLTLARRGMR